MQIIFVVENRFHALNFTKKALSPEELALYITLCPNDGALPL
jgi:hypothetical protein